MGVEVILWHSETAVPQKDPNFDYKYLVQCMTNLGVPFETAWKSR
jgi:hypothetical protein